MKQQYSRKLAALAALAVMPCQLQAATITSFTADVNGTSVTYPNATTLNNTAVLTSFTSDSVEYTNLTFVDSVTFTSNDGNHWWGTSSTSDPGSQTVALTDNRLDTMVLNVFEDSEFEFAAAPTSLSDVLFVFEVATPETGVKIQLIDSSNTRIGNEVDLVVTNTGESLNPESSAGGQNTWAINGGAYKISDFGITAGQLSSVDGFVYSTGGGTDFMVAGIATVPEPSSTALIGLGGLALILRRRRV